jgi:hypothetical protein
MLQNKSNNGTGNQPDIMKQLFSCVIHIINENLFPLYRHHHLVMVISIHNWIILIDDSSSLTERAYNFNNFSNLMYDHNLKTTLATYFLENIELL